MERDLFLKDFTGENSVIKGQLSFAAIIVRDKLAKASGYLFGRAGFPKIKFVDSHCDLIDCYGIVVPQLLRIAVTDLNQLSDLSNEKALADKLLILRPNGLFVYKSRSDVPILNEFEKASDLHYVLFGTLAMKALLNEAANKSKCT